MKKLFPTVALACLAAFSSVTATAGEAVVTYNNVENFTDFSYTESGDLQKLIADHFVKQAATLPANVALKVEVLDVDLAGVVKASFRAGGDFRTRTGRSDGPQMKIRFSLTENGKEILAGEETLSDQGYLRRQNRYRTTDELRYEKQMMDDWMSTRLGMKL